MNDNDHFISVLQDPVGLVDQLLETGGVLILRCKSPRQSAHQGMGCALRRASYLWIDVIKSLGIEDVDVDAGVRRRPFDHGKPAWALPSADVKHITAVGREAPTEIVVHRPDLEIQPHAPVGSHLVQNCRRRCVWTWAECLRAHWSVRPPTKAAIRLAIVGAERPWS
jgi:hypothetical protein